MKKAVMDHAMAAELESPEYTPAATRRLFMDSEVYCAVISVAVAHGVAKLLDKEERRKTITAKTQAMRDFFAEMAEGEMNEINGTPVLKMLDGQVNEEFGAWTPITTSLQGWVDLMKNIAQGLSTEAISELAEACRVSDSGLVTEELVERASAEFEAHVDHMCKMKYGEIDAGIEKTRAGWHEEKQEMETIMNARDNAPALPAIDGIINAAHKALAESKAPLCGEDVAKAINGTKRVTKAQIKEAEKQMKELHGLGILESNARAGGVSFYSLTVAPVPVPVAEVCDTVQTGSESQAVAEMTERQLTEAAQDDRNDFYVKYDGGNCSCHVSPPCGSCMHPGNPHNQDENPDCWETVSIVESQAEDSPISDELRAQMQSLNTWVQWLAPENYEMPPADPVLLASANRMLSDRLEGVAHALRGCGLPALAEISGAEDLQMATAALSGAYQMALVKAAELSVKNKAANFDLSNIGQHLGCDLSLDVPSEIIRAIDTLRAQVINLTASVTNTADLHKQITSLTTDVTNTRRALNDALNEADRMRTELAIERQARQALQEQVNAAPDVAPMPPAGDGWSIVAQEKINAAPAVAPLSYKVECSGLIYIKNTSDRAIKEAERLAKLHGCPATITANVPFGTVHVVKGVEFKAAKAA